MGSKYQRKQLEAFSILSPWETDPEESCIDRYCSDYVAQTHVHHDPTSLPKIHKRRAISTCATLKKQETHTPIEKTSSIKTDNDILSEFSLKNLTLLSSAKNDRGDRRRTDRGNVLQQLSVKNFIIEGGQDGGSMYREKVLKKRQSSYILKQKFADFRRSVKLSQNKQNANFKVVRYAA